MIYPIRTLGELCTFAGGGTPSREVAAYFEGDIPWVTVKDIQSFQVDGAQEHITAEALKNSSAKLVKANTVLLVSRVGLGKVAIARREVAINQDIKALTPCGLLLPEYLLWFLVSQSSTIKAMGAGATVKGVTLKDIHQIRIPLPSLPEQHRIVDIVSRAESIVHLRREAQKKAAALIPALFTDLFGDPATNPKHWPVILLGNALVSGPQNGLYKHSSFYGEGTPILRIDGFYDGETIEQRRWKRVRLSSVEAESFAIRTRDILINRVNSIEYLGKSAIVPPLLECAVFESNMMRMTFDDERVLPEFAIAYLQTAYAKQHFLSKAKRAINQASINQQDVTSLSLMLPPVPLQREFATRVQSIRSIQSQQATATSRAEATFNALLAQVFAPV